MSTLPDAARPISRTLIRACPVCAGVTGTIRHTQRVAVPDELGFGDAFDVATCDRCGFAFADLPTTQSELDRSYEQHSKYADETLIDEAAYSDPPWDAERMRAVAAWLSGEIADRDARVLDAGCAGGSFLGFMKQHGFRNLVGVDPSPRATAIARRVHGVDAFPGSFLTLPHRLGRFDLVTLQHTLEHLRDVRAAVVALGDALEDGGLAYVEVPDARHYADLLVAPFHDFNTEHINHFSLRVLDRLMRSEGFAPISTGEKTIMASARHRYPAAYGLWRKTAQTGAPVETGRDDDLIGAIDRYVERSHALMRRIDETLRTALAHADDVVVWGTGQLAFKLLRDTILARKRVTFVDGSPQKQGMHIAGRAIAGPAELERDSRPIVIGSVHAADAIAAAIAERFGPNRSVVRLPEGHAAG